MQPQAGSVRGMFAAVGRGHVQALPAATGDSPYASQGDTLARERDTDCVARRSSLRRRPSAAAVCLRCCVPNFALGRLRCVLGRSARCPKGKARSHERHTTSVWTGHSLSNKWPAVRSVVESQCGHCKWASRRCGWLRSSTATLHGCSKTGPNRWLTAWHSAPQQSAGMPATPPRRVTHDGGAA
jgi:hypothetical protein